jgi:hypothetical protein
MFANATQGQIILVLVLFYLLGSAGRVVWRYWLSKKGDAAITFNWHYLIGQIAVTVAGTVSLLLGGDITETIYEATDGNIALELLPIIGVLIAGYGSGSIGRAGQKTVDVARKK